ncbi:hypothetical protein TRAPUB_12415, partial [Trametes pubescens]
MSNAAEAIDVDAIPDPDPPSDDSEVVFTGFRRDAFKRSTSAKRAPSASKDGPPVKRHKPSPQPATANPHLKRPRAAIQSSSRIDADVISISDSDSEHASDSEWSSEDEHPRK